MKKKNFKHINNKLTYNQIHPEEPQIEENSSLQK